MLGRLSRGYMIAINWINGICAVVCGLAMMTGLFDNVMPLSIFDSFPLQNIFFASLFWPGLALLLVNGVANLVAVACKLFGNAAGWVVCNVIASLLLIIWTAVEMLLIPNGLSIFYMVVGFLQLLATLYVMNQEARKADRPDTIR